MLMGSLADLWSCSDNLGNYGWMFLIPNELSACEFHVVINVYYCCKHCSRAKTAQKICLHTSKAVATHSSKASVNGLMTRVRCSISQLVLCKLSAVYSVTSACIHVRDKKTPWRCGLFLLQDWRPYELCILHCDNWSACYMLHAIPSLFSAATKDVAFFKVFCCYLVIILPLPTSDLLFPYSTAP